MASSSSSSSSASGLSASAPPFFSSTVFQQQLYASSASASATARDEFGQGMHAAEGSQPSIRTFDGLLVENSSGYVVSIKGKEIEDDNLVQTPSTSTETYDLATLPNLTTSTEKGVSSKNSSEYDSDIDSPCYRGRATLASSEWPVAAEGSGHMNSLPPKRKVEEVKSLNPLAPPFIPCNAEGRVGSSRISPLDVEHASNVPSSREIIPSELEGKRQSASNSSSVISINYLLDLSEQLRQNFSNDSDSLGEQHHDILQRVINNLNVCTRLRTEQQNLVSESPHFGTSYYPGAANDICKGRYVGFQGVGNAYWLGDRNEHKKQKSLFSERDYRVGHSFSSASDTGIEMGDDVTQVMEKPMKENLETDEELHPQVLLYKKLWLEAVETLCSMKRKACVARMKSLKTQMDGSKSD